MNNPTYIDLSHIIYDGLVSYKGLPAPIIFGGYDNIIARTGFLGKLLRGTLQFLEQTPLKVFGLSHYWVVEKIDPAYEYKQRSREYWKQE